MTTALPPAYQPTSEADARIHAHQILGDDLSIDHVSSGDWHEALAAAADRWASVSQAQSGVAS